MLYLLACPVKHRLAAEVCNHGGRAAGSGAFSGARNLEQVIIATVSLGQSVGAGQNPCHIFSIFSILTCGAKKSVNIFPGGPYPIVVFCRVHWCLQGLQVCSC